MNYSKQTISQNTAAGILLVDPNRRIVGINKKAVQIWSFPEYLVDSNDEKQALEFAAFQLKNPNSFLKKVQKIYIDMELQTTYDTIKFRDGRIFERYSQPQWLEGEIVARIWKFREMAGWNNEPNLSNKILAFPGLDNNIFFSKLRE